LEGGVVLIELNKIWVHTVKPADGDTLKETNEKDGYWSSMLVQQSENILTTLYHIIQRG